MYWIGWAVEREDPVASASGIKVEASQVADRISNDSDTIIDNLLARLGQLAVSTRLRR
jgi:hypothetical protein